MDYDSTLSLIIDDPDKGFTIIEVGMYQITYYNRVNLKLIYYIYFSYWMRGAVRDTTKYFPTAIVSGRFRQKYSISYNYPTYIMVRVMV